MKRVAAINVSASPYGPEDQIGALNLMTPESRAAIMARVDAANVYDLSVDYFVGMPSYDAAGDPPYQIFMSHTPRGSVVDDMVGVGRELNKRVCYSGDVVFMYTHTGTHMDALNHFGIEGKVFNNFSADEHLGSRH